MKKLLFLLGFVFMFVGCKEASLIEGNWETRAFEINGIAQEICVSDISFTKSSKNIYSISGNSGVNRFFGSVKVKSSSFFIQDDMGSTKMLGEPNAMEFENNFLQTLIEAKSFKIFKENSSEFLEIKNDDETKRLVFIKK